MVQQTFKASRVFVKYKFSDHFQGFTPQFEDKTLSVTLNYIDYSSMLSQLSPRQMNLFQVRHTPLTVQIKVTIHFQVHSAKSHTSIAIVIFPEQTNMNAYSRHRQIKRAYSKTPSSLIVFNVITRLPPHYLSHNKKSHDSPRNKNWNKELLLPHNPIKEILLDFPSSFAAHSAPDDTGEKSIRACARPPSPPGESSTTALLSRHFSPQPTNHSKWDK